MREESSLYIRDLGLRSHGPGLIDYGNNCDIKIEDIKNNSNNVFGSEYTSEFNNNFSPILGDSGKEFNSLILENPSSKGMISSWKISDEMLIGIGLYNDKIKAKENGIRDFLDLMGVYSNNPRLFNSLTLSHEFYEQFEICEDGIDRLKSTKLKLEKLIFIFDVYDYSITKACGMVRRYANFRIR